MHQTLSKFLIVSFGTALLIATLVIFALSTTASIKHPAYINIEVNYPGATALTVEQTLAKPIEAKFVDMTELESIKSKSINGKFTAYLNFADTKSPEQLEYIVRARMAEVVRDQTDQLIKTLLTNASITIPSSKTHRLMLGANLDYAQLRDSVTGLLAELQQVKGINKMEIASADQPTVYINYNLDKLSDYSLTANELNSQLRNTLNTTALGDTTIEQLAAPTTLQADNSIQQLRDIVVYADNAIALSELATVRIEQPEMRRMGFFRSGTAEFVNSISVDIVTSLSAGELNAKVGEQLNKLQGVSGFLVQQNPQHFFDVRYQINSKYNFKQQLQLLARMEAVVADKIHSDLIQAYYIDENGYQALRVVTNTNNNIPAKVTELTNELVQAGIDAGWAISGNLQIELYSDDQSSIEIVKQELAQELAAQNITHNVINNSTPVVSIDLNVAKLIEQRVNSSELLATLQAIYRPEFIANIKDSGQDLKLMTKADSSFTSSIDDVRAIKITDNILLADIAEVVQVDSFSSIEHNQGKRFAEVIALIPAGTDKAQLIARLQQKFDAAKLQKLRVSQISYN
jgi:multidrug efflux pump subunit AcrB